ncbi:hypothetical protein HYC85_002324 [Camellia sinensis]|uniref:Knr4/Smi1-like domain-containing protein n=1 Tax=Camellia sinensis TaxID=4442 RepID=A0A7J7I8F2_CAMSI|nr:hypothetical protein HYC85_002324 [Camellia sinensis]
MAPTTTTVTEASISTAVKNQQQRHPKARRVCFSFAAYAKKVIQHLESCNVPIAEGLTDDEFSAVESQFNFTFPPDLRSILQEGLPVGPGFPNWRSSSSQQLEILTNLPILSLCKQVSIHNFWAHSWGDQPNDTNEAVQLAKRFLKNKSPILVPIYRHCYIPSSPNLAGNPVFYVHGADVRLASFDVAGFFHRVDFPVWAATEPRRNRVLDGDDGEFGAAVVVDWGFGWVYEGCVLEGEEWRVERRRGKGDDDDGRWR